MSFLPVSEALLRLEFEGLLESRPRAGTRVRIPSPDDVRGHYLVRETLETQAARLFAEVASRADRRRPAEARRAGRCVVAPGEPRAVFRPPPPAAPPHRRMRPLPGAVGGDRTDLRVVVHVVLRASPAGVGPRAAPASGSGEGARRAARRRRRRPPCANTCGGAGRKRWSGCSRISRFARRAAGRSPEARDGSSRELRRQPRHFAARAAEARGVGGRRERHHSCGGRCVLARRSGRWRPGVATAAATLAREPLETLTAAESDVLEAICARLIPTDANGPGATEAPRGALHRSRARRRARRRVRRTRRGSRRSTATRARRAARPFAKLSPADQDLVLQDVASGAATGFPNGSIAFFNLVRTHTIEGTFCDPYYGGNANFVGWDLIGYPGVRTVVTADEQRMGIELKPNHKSAYDYAMFTKASARASATARRCTDGGMATRLKDTDVVIIGLGAAGGVAALPLAQAGLDVVGLEAGTWLTRRDFAPDELRNNVRDWPQAVQKAQHEVPTQRVNARAPTLRANSHPMMNAVGGTTLHYWAQSWRLNPWDFKVVSETTRRLRRLAHPERIDRRGLAVRSRRARAVLRQGRVRDRRVRPGGQHQRQDRSPRQHLRRPAQARVSRCRRCAARGSPT